MKLLGWMHRKFRQNSNEPFKDFSLGQASVDDPPLMPYHPKLNYSINKQLIIRGQRENQVRKSFASTSDPATADHQEDADQDLLLEEETSSGAFSELFHGFLAIGTLGTDVDPSTPTFSIAVENIMEKETEVTENELKLINDELEKVLGADEISCNLSSGRNSHVSSSAGRNSHVSAGRSSHCSVITLGGGGKPLESTENINIINGNNNIGTGTGTLSVCPLQGYLLGSAAIGLPLPAHETTAKKEHRISLGELFQKTKQLTAEDNCGSAKPPEKKPADKEYSDKSSSAFLVKKLLKRKLLHASNRNCLASSGAGGTTDSASAETKLHKILNIFHRKVHPESSTTTTARKSTSNTNTKPTTGGHLEVRSGEVRPYITEASEHGDEDIIITPYQALSKQRLRRHFKTQSNPLQLSLGATGEHWIKTDSDYLVLEL